MATKTVQIRIRILELKQPPGSSSFFQVAEGRFDLKPFSLISPPQIVDVGGIKLKAICFVNSPHDIPLDLIFAKNGEIYSFHFSILPNGEERIAPNVSCRLDKNTTPPFRIAVTKLG